VVFDGVAGVEPQSETVWRQADKYNVPRVCFINKLDRMGASFEKSFHSILNKLTPNAVAVGIPMGLEEKLAGVIDLMKMKALYFEGDKGIDVVEKDIPEGFRKEAEIWHKKMIEKIAGEDNALTEKFLKGEEISVDEIKNV
jgi:elongation factor G